MLRAMFVPAEAREAVSDRAWLQALLDAERALATAEARVGVIPAAAAAAIADACRADLYDVAEIAERGRAVGNPAEPLVRALRERLGGDAATWVHHGATSQDVVDTAAMLVARRALAPLRRDLEAVAEACARLADQHRATILAGRTLLQQAVPTTFGLKAAGWLVAVVEARARLCAVRLAAQLGGAAGTLAPLGASGADVLRLYAEELELEEPVVPWHANRLRIAELGAALDLAAGALAKIALDVALLSQTEVAEVAEPPGGVSSTMPQKRNPARSTLARACARHVHACASVLTGGLEQEHERAAGAWQAEWEALTGALAYAAGAAVAVREALEGLTVDVERMRRNLDPRVMSERVSFLLAERVGRAEAHERVAVAASLRDLAPPEALEPESYLGSAAVFVDRALAFHREAG